MGYLMHQNLRNTEVERLAYISGNAVLSAYVADVEDLENQVFGFDDQLDAVREAAHYKGRIEGVGEDTHKTIEALSQEIAKLKADHRQVRDSLQGVLTWLRGSEHNTVAKRKAFEKRVSVALNCTPRY